MRQIEEIIVHASATRPRWFAGCTPAEKVREIRRWHTIERGWSDIGYHWLIDRCGTVVPGRSEHLPGAHVRGRNADTIGICLIGGHGGAATDAFADHFTPAQAAALRRLIDERKAIHGITKFSGHNQYAVKACPCFDLPAWLAAGRSRPARSVAARVLSYLRRLIANLARKEPDA